MNPELSLYTIYLLLDMREHLLDEICLLCFCLPSFHSPTHGYNHQKNSWQKEGFLRWALVCSKYQHCQNYFITLKALPLMLRGFWQLAQVFIINYINKQHMSLEHSTYNK